MTSTVRATQHMKAPLKIVLVVVVHALMLGAVLSLWNNDAPSFIYVAF